MSKQPLSDIIGTLSSFSTIVVSKKNDDFNFLPCRGANTDDDDVLDPAILNELVPALLIYLVSKQPLSDIIAISAESNKESSSSTSATATSAETSAASANIVFRAKSVLALLPNG